MTKTMGKQYKITANGEWDKISELARATKELIANTKPKSFYPGFKGLEDHMLTAYLTPKQNESFEEYKGRFIEAFAGDGFKGAIASLLVGQRVPFKFTLTHNNGESTLLVDTTTKNRRYEAIISVSGIYSERGASIAEGLKELLERNNVQHRYKSLDKLI